MITKASCIHEGLQGLPPGIPPRIYYKRGVAPGEFTPEVNRWMDKKEATRIGDLKES